MFQSPRLQNLKHDLPASIVVFLVALPLCLGISIASGVPPALGLMTGIVGGIIVGLFAGSPLQVSGPAAGLTVIVLTIVQNYGLQGLAVAVFISGLLQLIAGLSGIGRWFKAISPAVIYGMLAGIGIIILSGQFHYMVDDTAKGSVLENLLTIPYAIYKGFFSDSGWLTTIHQQAALIGLVTILSLVLWEKFKPKRLHSLPGALIAVFVATVVASSLAFPISRIALPHNLADSVNFLSLGAFSLLKDVNFIHEIVGLAVIASAETLLCATAVDKMAAHSDTNYNKELSAQGLGNIICGIIGALPMTGVIVRSSANVEAGAQTRLSAILHGVWILILVMSFPVFLSLIPTSALAAILVYTGYKLVNFMNIKKIARYGKSEVFIYLATVLGIVCVDLLAGVLTGLVLSLLKIIVTISSIDVEEKHEDKVIEVGLTGAATVLTLPKLTQHLDALMKYKKDIHIHLDGLTYIDHSCMDYLETVATRLKVQGAKLTLDSQKLQHKVHRFHLNPEVSQAAKKPHYLLRRWRFKQGKVS